MKLVCLGKKLLLISGLIVSLMILSANITFAQSLASNKAAQRNWNTFWNKFKTSVKTKNRKAIISLTSKKFFSPGGETIGQFLNQSFMWKLLRDSVKTGTKSHTCRNLPCRITKNPIIESSLLFVFENNRWSFIGQLGE